MSFKLGTFNTDNIPGFKAILKEWPTLPVDLTLDELPAGDGSLFYRAQMESTEWEFDLELRGNDLNQVMSRATTISRSLNPVLLGGPRDFTPNAFDGWVWQGVLGGQVAWERDKVLWFSDQGVCVLRGRLKIVTPDPYGYQVGAPVTISAAGNLALAAATGANAGFYPVITFRGVLASDQAFVARGIQVMGPLTATQTLVLDFGSMDFYIKTTATGAKVRNVGDRITGFTRLFATNSMSVACSVTGGTFTEATGVVPSRRI